MARQDFLDGFNNRWPPRFHTADHQAGRIALDKANGTNNTGWNPPKPKLRPAPTPNFFGPPKRKGWFS